MTAQAWIATAYAEHCDGSGRITASGLPVASDVIAVDPRIIPLGSVVYVNGIRKRALDTGGLIKGHRIDLWMPSCKAAIAWGVRRVRVSVEPVRYAFGPISSPPPSKAQQRAVSFHPQGRAHVASKHVIDGLAHAHARRNAADIALACIIIGLAVMAVFKRTWKAAFST